MEPFTDEYRRDHAENVSKMRWTLTRRDLLERLREAEADYTVTYGSGELYGRGGG